jgi:hypothetical protein
MNSIDCFRRETLKQRANADAGGEHTGVRVSLEIAEAVLHRIDDPNVVDVSSYDPRPSSMPPLDVVLKDYIEQEFRRLSRDLSNPTLFAGSWPNRFNG